MEQPETPQEEQAEFIDAPIEENVHRGEDEHGNPDDNYTEDEALALAKKQGIEHVDTYTVEDPNEETDFLKTKYFDTYKEAEQFCQENDIDPLKIIQVRTSQVKET